MRNVLFVSMVASLSLMACTAESVDDADLAALEGATPEIVAASPITIPEALDISRGLPTNRSVNDGLETSDHEATDRARCNPGEWVRVQDDSPEAQEALEAFKATFSDVSNIDIGWCAMCGYDWSCWWEGKERYKTGFYVGAKCVAVNTSQCCN
ncbi:MAG: hypothetical protein IPM54_08910 [Polyangiaceae bacterium]|nr:hypothetical protein [Polyangiaceae bacterium]